jgi:N6-adenosine-specific RNA methylase IME4
LEYHDIANIFPLLTGSEFESLRDDIAKNGLLEPIVVYEGKILDGRNRHAACLGAGVLPDMVDYTGDDPLAFVVSKNKHRRHLTAGQLAFVGAEVKRIESERAKERQRGGQGGVLLTENIPEAKGEARDIAAKKTGANPKYIDLAEKMQEEAPDLADEVKSGEKSMNRAKQEMKQREKKAEAEAYSFHVISKPALEKKYNVIYADPPWKYNTGINTLDAVTDAHYSTMSLDGVCKYPASLGLQIQDDAVLFLWVTNPFLVKALDVVKAWGFEYKSQIVWVKTNLSRPGVGYYVRGRHEMLWICTKGSFTPLDKNISPPIGSVLEADVREHSRKPDKVYDIIERLYPGCVYAELFARYSKEGWESFGDNIDVNV